MMVPRETLVPRCACVWEGRGGGGVGAYIINLQSSILRVTRLLFCWSGEFVVLRFYGPVNPVGSCRARSVYLTTRLLGRLSPLSG